MIADEHDIQARAWLTELTNEYQRICYFFGIKLTPPIIRIAALQSSWGLWQSYPRMISIAHRLITNYPWNTVIEVLKHEMAHQMVSEIHCRDDEHHGELFRSCCRQLGMAAWSMQAEIELGAQVFANESEAGDVSHNPVLRKVKKLLALGSSSEKHEAELAMQRVREICDRHNLKSLPETDDQYVMQILNQHKKRLSREQLGICGLLTSNFAVNVICSSLYHAADNTTYRTIELFGRAADVKIAEYVYHFLLNQINTLWDKARTALPAQARRSKSSFSEGLLAGFAQTLALREKTDVARQARALTVQLQAQAVNFSKTRCPRVRSVSVGGRRYRRDSYTRGYEAGRKLKLRKGMDDGSAPLRLKGGSS